jgi:hypothetical protein
MDNLLGSLRFKSIQIVHGDPLFGKTDQLGLFILIPDFPFGMLGNEEHYVDPNYLTHRLKYFLHHDLVIPQCTTPVPTGNIIILP